jgi:hypothetical protein
LGAPNAAFGEDGLVPVKKVRFCQSYSQRLNARRLGIFRISLVDIVFQIRHSRRHVFEALNRIEVNLERGGSCSPVSLLVVKKGLEKIINLLKLLIDDHGFQGQPLKNNDFMCCDLSCLENCFFPFISDSLIEPYWVSLEQINFIKENLFSLLQKY